MKGIFMGTELMGRVTTQATILNLEDLWAIKQGQLDESEARQLVVDDALVDTGATTLALPTRLIQRLGLNKRYDKTVTTSKGKSTTAVYEPVRLTIQGRDCTVDVMEVPDDVPALIGQIPLEMMDLVVDLQARKLIGNPAHGGEHILELY
jgi:clan AA aspartic protease